MKDRNKRNDFKKADYRLVSYDKMDDESSVRKTLIEGARDFSKNLNSTYHQLRKYYEEVLSVYRDVKKKNEFDDSQKIRIYLLSSKANYDVHRQSAKLDPAFRDFIDNWVENIKDKKDVEKFKIVFEAILGFAKK